MGAGWADRGAGWALGLLALALATYGAEPFAGGFNDGGRLATAESLIDRGTLCIDDSVFVRPQASVARGLRPYGPAVDDVNRVGTLDRVFIGGRFYSDKPAVPAVLLAGAYRALMAVGLPAPGDRPDVFCRASAVLTCGLGYAVAVGCLWVLGRRSGLGAGWRLAWVGAFALAGVLPAYTRQVNAGVPQLAAVAGLAVLLCRAADGGRGAAIRLVGAGACAGFGYTLDLGSGPPLLACAGLAVLVRWRSARACGWFLLGALPFVAANHAFTLAVGGVWVPLGLVPEYLNWPGSPFDTSNMTGIARHGPLSLAEYAWNLLLSPGGGFLTTNPPLLLAVPAGWLVLRRPGPHRVELAALCGWCAAVWLVYAVLSDNYGGGCLSVRWFVPFLVPGYWLLARLLAERPTFRADFAVLAAVGLVLGCRMWELGPWVSGPVPGREALTYSALGGWAAVRALVLVRGCIARRPSL